MRVFFCIKIVMGVLWLQLWNGIAEVMREWPPLVNSEFTLGRTGLLFPVKYFKFVGSFVYEFRLKCRVHNESSHVIEHSRHDLADILVGHAQVRIGVDLN